MPNFNTFENVLYCGEYVAAHQAVLLYTHVPAVFAAVVLTVLLLRRSQERRSIAYFSALTASFSIWVILDLLIWFGYAHSAIVMTAWAPIEFVSVSMFLFALLFLRSYLRDEGLSWRALLLYSAPAAVLALIAPTALYLTHYDLVECIAVEHTAVTMLSLVVKVGYVIVIAYESVRAMVHVRTNRLRTIILSGGMLLFLAAHAFASYFAVMLDNYRYEGYSLLLMVVFLALFTSLIVQYQIFDLRLAGVQVFVLALVTLILSQLFFVRSTPNLWLTAFTAVMAAGFGHVLVQTYQREQENRRKGERLARYLANANARLRELDKQKTEFISVASHQLRSPIAAIKGYAAMMVEGSYGEVPKSLVEPIERILESGNRIAIMVDDFLNVTRIEQGRLTYNLQRIEPCTLVRRAVDELRILAKNKGVALTLETPPKATFFINADESKISQVVLNVIDNAIKYTPKGFVTVFVEPQETQRTVVIRVVDSGIGIPQGEVPNLFRKLGRASNANEATVNGTGLGLYIAREIVRAHNGWIHVSSPGVGKGSTFTIELPLVVEEGTPAGEKKQ